MAADCRVWGDSGCETGTDKMIQPVLKYPGAKWSIAKWILGFMPEHEVYLEPFFGSGAVFFNKRPARIETINDIDGDVVNLFRVIRTRAEELAALIEMTPWARDEYLESYHRTGDELEDARRFLVRCWQAFGTRTGGGTGWRSDVHGRKQSCPQYWSKVPQRILAVTSRLKQAQIENEPADKIIKRYAFDNVLIYADPPYPMSTRTANIYAHEMTDEEHLELLDLLEQHPGPVLLSSYENEIYSERLKHWNKESKRARAELGHVRKEVLWLNGMAAKKLSCMLPLFK